MFLKELIEYLEKKDPNIVVPVGFCCPHSYRGYYIELAFIPEKDTTVGAMLECAKTALGETYTGWKGGEFTMGECTDVYLAEHGELGEEIGKVLLDYMTGGTGATK